MKKTIVVGITGATGVKYGIRALEILQELNIKTILVISESGKKNIPIETDYSLEYIKDLATAVYNNQDMTAPIASGSYKVNGMVVLPCTIKTLSSIANSYSANLITRAADVMLKEKRKLILAIQESPLHIGHLSLMKRASEFGAYIVPPLPVFYNRPQNLEDIINNTVGKILDIMGIETKYIKRWNGKKKEDYNMIEQTNLKENTYYWLIKNGEKTLAYFYRNQDAKMNPKKPLEKDVDYSELGFGFNIADGGGFLSLSDLQQDVKIIEATIK